MYPSSKHLIKYFLLHELSKLNAQVVALFGGERVWWKFVNDNNLSFFSDLTEENTIVTTCHPEFLTNTRYLNWYTLNYLMVMTGFIRRLGDSWVTVLITYALLVMTSFEKNGGSDAYKLLEQIEKERRACQTKLY